MVTDCPYAKRSPERSERNQQEERGHRGWCAYLERRRFSEIGETARTTLRHADEPCRRPRRNPSSGMASRAGWTAQTEGSQRPGPSSAAQTQAPGAAQHPAYVGRVGPPHRLDGRQEAIHPVRRNVRRIVMVGHVLHRGGHPRGIGCQRMQGIPARQCCNRCQTRPPRMALRFDRRRAAGRVHRRPVLAHAAADPFDGRREARPAMHDRQRRALHLRSQAPQRSHRRTLRADAPFRRIQPAAMGQQQTRQRHRVHAAHPSEHRRGHAARDARDRPRLRLAECRRTANRRISGRIARTGRPAIRVGMRAAWRGWFSAGGPRGDQPPCGRGRARLRGIRPRRERGAEGTAGRRSPVSVRRAARDCRVPRFMESAGRRRAACRDRARRRSAKRESVA
ncbi:hypothetical protein BBIA_1074 [Bifidobacterium biavatii DSM 23969]|uniref:Uncharacterized protein n=1 Tax=Bifidobacterium biavatii DSM 23969 TaxID=1437608 RepID=A0A087A2U8_9BIFI|nr:hypothetical protein BBIA_1074 [Bifidobacterium biavatii DSM 23969]